jgi:poly [ADP-ribose] polymerase 1
MADLIEESKSSRATCRSCREKIDKGVLRFGEEIPNQFDPEGGTAFRWHHLHCAAGRMPAKVQAALAAFSGAVPDRDKLEALLANPPKTAARKGGPKAAYPYAEKATTSRSRCLQCDEAIEKDTFRIAVERAVDTGAFTTTGPGYLHPRCAFQYTGEAGLLEKLKAHASGLSAEDLEVLAGELGGGDGVA